VQLIARATSPWTDPASTIAVRPSRASARPRPAQRPSGGYGIPYIGAAFRASMGVGSASDFLHRQRRKREPSELAGHEYIPKLTFP